MKFDHLAVATYLDIEVLAFCFYQSYTSTFINKLNTLLVSLILQCIYSKYNIVEYTIILAVS